MSLNEIRMHHDMIVVYDKISRILTDYENPKNTNTVVTEADLYNALVDAQNYLAKRMN